MGIRVGCGRGRFNFQVVDACLDKQPDKKQDGYADVEYCRDAVVDFKAGAGVGGELRVAL